MIGYTATIATVSRRTLRERAVELAGSTGRSTQDTTKADWDQAKAELLGTSVHKESQFPLPQILVVLAQSSTVEACCANRRRF